MLASPTTRMTAPFSTDKQPRVKLIWDLVQCPKIVKPFLIRFRMNTYSTTIDDLLFVQRIRQRDTGRGANLGTRCFPKLFLDNF